MDIIDVVCDWLALQDNPWSRYVPMRWGSLAMVNFCLAIIRSSNDHKNDNSK